ncbi:hypothetical protein THIX_30740 [Thiomonas sp. X19]|uniref:hypothetical protein n=1 Tax=Thiomonas sp. X19 TaxID=1050370 RepID=UPI000B72BAF9|nr:hypothetical protein [Thiomonas sp. X19]SCC93512.1 hypothetical protein THIX_30740 [Thiomonas sp. X19]
MSPNPGNHRTEIDKLLSDNNALWIAIELMGLDPGKVIDAIRSPRDNFWYRATLGSLTCSIDPENPRIKRSGFSDKAVVTMQAILSDLRARKPAQQAQRKNAQPQIAPYGSFVVKPDAKDL